MENYEELISLLRKEVSVETKDKLEEKLTYLSNPLGSEGITFQAQDQDKIKNSFTTLGGGGQVNGVNQGTTLGGSRAGTNISVNVGGNASVRIQMWFPLASVPAGSWVVGGPGASNFQLNCNVLHQPPGCPQWFGQPVTITATGISGTFPVWVSFNP
jgi:hypothetical protein